MTKRKRKAAASQAATIAAPVASLVLVEETMAAGIKRARRITPIEGYLRHRLITAEQWEAGVRFNRDYLVGVEGVREAESTGKTDPWNRGPSHAQLAALADYSAALRAVNRDLHPLLIAIVGRADTTAEAFDAARKCRKGKAMTLLKSVLSTLVDHYERVDCSPTHNPLTSGGAE